MIRIDQLPGDAAALEALIGQGPIEVEASADDTMPAHLLAVARSHPGRVVLVQASARLIEILRHIHHARAFGLEQADGSSRYHEEPYVVAATREGDLLVVLTTAAQRTLSERWDPQWVANFDAARIIIDATTLEQAQSTMVAWMLRLYQFAQSRRATVVIVRGIRRQVATQLRQLKLDRLLQFEES